MTGNPEPVRETADGGLSAREIRGALDRLTGVPPLSRSARLSGFLRYLVDETLAGRAQAISGYTIGIDVFKRPESFDPTVDSIVRVEAGRLRRRLAEYYREAGQDDPVEISLPKGNYVPKFAARSHPDDAASRAAPAPDRGPSIAVLPFQNYSANAGDQYFADGLTEETIANLARFKDLFVFSRTTTAKLHADGADIRTLRAVLGVTFVLESSVRSSPGKVRVAARLIDAATDGHIFVEHFERGSTPEGVFEIQDEIARLVASRVADRYGPLGRYIARASRSGRSRRWDTYMWVFRFYEYYATHRPDLHLEVRDGLEATVQSDLESSDAWAALAAIYLDEYRFHLNERNDFPARDRALEAALRSVACDPDNAMAYQFLAVIYYHRGEFAEFEIAAARALELNPGHADMLADIGMCYAYAGHWDRGLELTKRAHDMSPVHPGWYHMVPACRKLLDNDPIGAVNELKQVPMTGFFWYHAMLACFHGWAGRDADAANERQALLSIMPAFADIALQECAIWTVNEELTAKIAEGWRKAGLLSA